MTNSNARRKSLVLIVIAALMWSSSGLFAKADWFDWPPETRGIALTFWRAVFAALAVLPFVRKPTFRIAMVPMSLSFTIMTWAFLGAMVAGSETTTIWLQYVGPAWVAIGGLMGLGDRPNRRDGGMIGLSIIGISLIVFFESTAGGGSTATGPVGLGLLSGVTYAGVLLSIRHLRGVDVAWIGLVNYSVSAICLAPFVIGKIPMPTGAQWFALAAFGALQLGIPYMLFAWAVREVQSNEASLITLIEPLAVPVWTFLVWRHHPHYEYPAWWTMFGAIFIAGGFIWRYGRRQPKTEANDSHSSETSS